MRIRMLSERGGHGVGTELEVAAADPQAAAWLANVDAEVIPDAPVQTSAQDDSAEPAAADVAGVETAMRKKAKGR